MNNFETRLSAALEQVQAGTAILAAVSGGADSTAMLAGLAALREEKTYILNCIHVEHGIRSVEESRGDADAVEALCGKLNVPCRIYSIPRGKVAALAAKKNLGIQAAARHFRHKFFRTEARRIKAARILLGHTRDDLLENLLMRILRGSGPSGLAVMPQNKGLLFRPILEMTRQELLDYLEERDIPYREDSSNSDIHYLRSRVRHKLIPVLDEFFPHWRTSLLALAQTQALTADFLNSEAEKRLPWQDANTGPHHQGKVLRLPEELFLKAPQILREEAIFLGTNLLTKMPGTVPRRAVLRKAVKQNLTSDLGPVRLERQDGHIILRESKQSRSKKQHLGERGFSLLINEAGLYTLEGRLLGMDYTQRLCIKVAASSRFPLLLRKHRDGDRLQRGRHRQRFSDIMGRATKSVCTEVITACDENGPLALIGITHDGEIIIIDRETYARDVFNIYWERMDV